MRSTAGPRRPCAQGADRRTYDPFGRITNTSSLTAAAVANPWRYASAYQDTEGDNDYHLGARYYDPILKRFTEPDTIVGNTTNPKTADIYDYANGDPMNATDPTGHNISDKITSTVSAGLAGQRRQPHRHHHQPEHAHLQRRLPSHLACAPVRRRDQ